MSRRRAYIELGEIPTLKEAYEEKMFSPRNVKRAAKWPRQYPHNEEFNKKISLIQADITKLKIDAIVNAANETLLGGGGVDGAIHRAAGPELRSECWDLNGCDTGDAKITKGYDLPSKHVIHTVGPIGEKPSLLRSAYERSMVVMCENNLKSVAFSNISTGVYGYPRLKAGQIALDTTRNWLEKNLDYLEKLDRIIFCVFEDENKDVYESLFPIFFPPPPDLDNYENEEEHKSKANENVDKVKEERKEKSHITTEQGNVKDHAEEHAEKHAESPVHQQEKNKEKVEQETHNTAVTDVTDKTNDSDSSETITSDTTNELEENKGTDASTMGLDMDVDEEMKDAENKENKGVEDVKIKETEEKDAEDTKNAEIKETEDGEDVEMKDAENKDAEDEDAEDEDAEDKGAKEIKETEEDVDMKDAENKDAEDEGAKDMHTKNGEIKETEDVHKIKEEVVAGATKMNGQDDGMNVENVVKSDETDAAKMGERNVQSSTTHSENSKDQYELSQAETKTDVEVTSNNENDQSTSNNENDQSTSNNENDQSTLRDHKEPLGSPKDAHKAYKTDENASIEENPSKI